MSETHAVPETQPPEQAGDARQRFIESLLDNLPGWTVVALAIALLYLVWATLEILSRYTGVIPEVTP